MPCRPPSYEKQTIAQGTDNAVSNGGTVEVPGSASNQGMPDQFKEFTDAKSSICPVLRRVFRLPFKRSC